MSVSVSTASEDGIHNSWFLEGNGGMDPYGSPLRSRIVVPNT